MSSDQEFNEEFIESLQDTDESNEIEWIEEQDKDVTRWVYQSKKNQSIIEALITKYESLPFYHCYFSARNELEQIGNNMVLNYVPELEIAKFAFTDFLNISTQFTQYMDRSYFIDNDKIQ